MPAGFQYPALPAPAPTNQLVRFSLPIRINCGSYQTVNGFVPDPNMMQGGVNSANSHINTNTPDAAPATVYQSERYGKDFTYTFPVPKNERYLVRLHFAEIFDNGAGRRLEDIYINHRQVLTNLDIFSVAGGMDKALVETFSDVRPDRHGDITIRVTSAPTSPDQNAKISAIEIRRQN